MKTFQPLGKRVLVLPDSAPTHAGGIILPEHAVKPDPMEATVVASNLPEVPVGAKVLAKRYEGERIKLQGKEHHLLTEQEIFAILS